MKQYERISQYRVMWIFVLFDLPTETQKDIKAYAQFRKNIMRDWLYYVPVFNLHQTNVLVLKM